MQKVEEYIGTLCDNEIELVLSLGLMHTKQFYYIIRDKKSKKKVGQCGIRLLENEEQEYLGNIEYEIFTPYQGKHLAYQASMLLSNVALLFGVRKISITANPTNLASIKTIEKLGAKFVCIKKVPKTHRLYKSGNHEVAVYDGEIEKRRQK